MKIAIISPDKELKEKIDIVIKKSFNDIPVFLFDNEQEFVTPFDNSYDIIIVDYKFEETTGIEVIKNLKNKNYSGWIIALSPNILLTNDLSDAGAKIAILRDSIELIESILIGVIEPLTTEEAEKKYGYTSNFTEK